MIITCEACKTQFKLDEALLNKGGSKVRCSLCKQIFTVYPAVEEKKDELDDLTALEYDINGSDGESGIFDQEMDFDLAEDELEFEDDLEFETDLEFDTPIEDADALGIESIDEPMHDMDFGDGDLQLENDIDFTQEEKVQEDLTIEDEENDDLELDVDFGLDPEPEIAMAEETDLKDDFAFEIEVDETDAEDSDETENDIEETLDLAELDALSQQDTDDDDLTEMDFEASEALSLHMDIDSPDSPDSHEESEEPEVLEEETSEDYLGSEQTNDDLEPGTLKDLQTETWESDGNLSQEQLMPFGGEEESFKKPPRKTSRLLILLLLLCVIAAGTYVAASMKLITIPYLSNVSLPSIPYLDKVQIPYLSDYLNKNKAPAAPIKVIPDKKSVNGHFVTNATEGTLFVITGNVINQSKIRCSRVKVKGALIIKKNVEVKTKEVFCGNLIAEDKLKTLDMKSIHTILMRETGANQNNINIDPGGSVPFMIVFSELPDSLQNYTVKVAGFDPETTKK